MNDELLATLSDEEINGYDTHTLRKRADLLDAYSQRKTVLTIQLTDQVLRFAGGLTAVDKLIETLCTAYLCEDRDPQVKVTYSSVEMTVWEDDENLRQSLRYYAGRARTKLEESADRNRRGESEG
jgi:hypothetical protein